MIELTGIRNRPSTSESVYFDYDKQVWVKNGRYVRCGHPDSTVCGCFGRTHEGEPAN